MKFAVKFFLPVIIAIPNFVQAADTSLATFAVDPNLISLGASFDSVTKSALVNRCLKYSPDELLESRIDGASGQEWRIDIMENQSDLYNFLSTTTTAKGHGEYDIYSGDVEYVSKVVKENYLDNYSVVIAGRFVYPQYIINSTDVGQLKDLSPYSKSIYNNRGKVDFRNFCGDGYFSKIVMGVSAQFVLKVTAVNGSTQVSRERVESLKAAVSDLGNASVTDERKEEIISTFSTYSLSAYISASGLGGSDGYKIQVMNISDLVDFISQLHARENHSPVPVKAYVSDYRFSTINVDVQSDMYDRWVKVKTELSERCNLFSNDELVGSKYSAINIKIADDMLENDKGIQSACNKSEFVVSEKINDCSKTDRFHLCQPPTVSECTYQGYSCSEFLNGSLIPAWIPISKHQRYAKKFNSGKTHVRELTVCLPENTIFDVSRGDMGYDRTSNNRNSVHTHERISYNCDKTTFSVKSKGGINFSSDIYLYGLQSYETSVLEEF